MCDSVIAEADMLLEPQFAFESEELLRNLSSLESNKRGEKSQKKKPRSVLGAGEATKSGVLQIFFYLVTFCILLQ